MFIEKTYKEYQFKIYNFLIKKANGNINIAEEVLSDTFYSLIKYEHTIKNKNNVKNWLMQVAIRRFFDYIKTAYKEEEKERRITDYTNDNTDSIEKEITDILFEKQKVHMTSIAINNLKDEYRNVLLFRYYDNKSAKDIAKTIKKTVSSVESLLIRAKRTMKKELFRISEDFNN